MQYIIICVIFGLNIWGVCWIPEIWHGENYPNSLIVIAYYLEKLIIDFYCQMLIIGFIVVVSCS